MEQHSTWYNRTEPEPAPRPTTADKLAERRIARRKRLANPTAAAFERAWSAEPIEQPPAYH